MFLEKYLLKALHGVHLVARPMTLGVRGAAFDEAGRVFLVRHTYVSGWHMPGGGVDPGETAVDALKREFREEGNLEPLDVPRLVAVYFNRSASNRDHVLFYHCGACRQTAPKTRDAEISETGFFALDALPDGVTPGTRRRLSELRGDSAIALHW
ncbi:NUDIX domain-containing protein [Aurantimonas marianensis]|uniref:NUDIX domain-containing protein n=1 Tax=Aurantimonas marianensis TaxID=2920428 RepID=A0A9X2H755_9HYPH|nr:NUDIX domain-containing protein [Aurantimonas marianensis]MCP3055476.1 NUDIX domain-containing protein [Aurantimonas marianensis]